MRKAIFNLSVAEVVTLRAKSNRGLSELLRVRLRILCLTTFLVATTGSVGVTQENDADGTISPFAENVLIHVVLHELGHGLVREFDLPVLGNEETLADAFATHYVVSKMPDRALEILESRIASLMIEAEEVARNEWTVKGEHNSDARRAYQTAALAIAYDSKKYAPLAALVSMSESEMRSAADYGGELHRSWRRILKPLWMPDGQQSNEARMSIEEEAAFAESLGDGSLPKTIENVLRSFDWHSQVSVRFAQGDGGAGWSRSRRTVTVYDEYIQRFNRQGDIRAKQAK